MADWSARTAEAYSGVRLPGGRALLDCHGARQPRRQRRSKSHVEQGFNELTRALRSRQFESELTLVRFRREREAKEPATVTLGLDCACDTGKRFARRCE